MSALTSHEQELYNLALASLPRWYSTEVNPQVVVGAFAKLFGKAWDQIDAWVNIIYLKQAFGIWLDAHARDYGTRRQTNESDGALLARLESPQDALTKSALLAIGNAIIAGAGVSDIIHISEGRIDAGGYWDPGFAGGRAFWGVSGHRWDGHPHDIYVIVPATADNGTAAAVAAAMRLWAAGGVDVFVEHALDFSNDSYQIVTITPPAAQVAHGGVTQQFTVQTRFADTVTWMVNGNVGGNAVTGTISGSGLYTAPASVPYPEDVEIEAYSPTYDVTGTARVKIT